MADACYAFFKFIFSVSLYVKIVFEKILIVIILRTSEELLETETIKSSAKTKEIIPNSKQIEIA